MPGRDRANALSILAVTGLVGTVFVIAGIVLASDLDGVARLAGVAMVVMGIISLVIAVTYGLGGLAPQTESAPVAAAVPRTGSVVYQRSLKGYADVIVSVGAALFVTLFFFLSIAIVAEGEGAWAPAILISAVIWFLITPATVLGLIRLASDRSVLELAPAGLRLPGLGWIRWVDIERLAIEDTRPLVERPGTKVIGSMRQLAIHLRDGVEPPAGNALDRAYRRLAQGYFAVGAAAGKGRYHWLAVRERELDVPLEQVLDVASVYHTRVVGPAGAAPAVPESARETAPLPATAAVAATRSSPSPDPVLAAEAAALVASERRIVEDEQPPSRAVRWVGTLGGVLAGGTVGAFLGRQMVDATLIGPLPPWPFLALVMLMGGFLYAYRVARRRRSWSTRPLALLVPVTIVGFMVGMFTTTGAGPAEQAGPRTAPTPIPTLQVQASAQMPDAGPNRAIDGNERTSWNAGAHPPAWIELDLGVEGPVTGIKLLVEQTPDGPTVHHVYVAADDGRYEHVHTFEGVTRSGQWLAFTPESPLVDVRAVVIETVESPSWVAWREVVVLRP
jgi:hypothetical protein